MSKATTPSEPPIRVDKDALGFPVVHYRTQEVDDPGFRVGRIRIYSGIVAVIAFFMAAGNLNPHDNNYVLILGIILFMISAGIFKGATNHVENNPVFTGIENTLALNSADLGQHDPALIHYRDGHGRNTIPYNEALSFTVGSNAEWSFTAEHKRTVENAHIPTLIVTKDASGSVYAVAVHSGNQASVANIHSAITDAFVTGYPANMRLYKRLLAERRAPSRPSSSSDDKPLSL